MRKVLLGLVLITLSLSFFAQERTIQIVDSQTEYPISFVKVNDGVGRNYISDIDGKISLNVVPENGYTFRFFGYQDTVLTGVKLLDNPKVYLRADAQVYDEVVIRPGENPAHRIIRNVMDNRKKNDPLRNNSFRYNSYSKFFLTGNLKDDIIRDTITDTSEIKMLKLLDEQYLFLIETRATRTFNPPNYDKEEITSYNVSGIKEPYFATLVNQFQSFSFYDYEFQLGGTEYISPLAPGSLKRYFFLLEDTLVHSETNDTTFIISYRPTKGKNFTGLEGYLYINTKGWAIERVIASPYNQEDDKDLIGVKIIQEYAFINEFKWFPIKISTELDFPIEVGKHSSAIGRSSLYIQDVEFDVKAKKGFNPIAVEVKPGALSDSSSIHEARGETYTGKEEQTYYVIDSLAIEANIDRFVSLFKILSTGVIPVWKLGIPLDRLMTVNYQEGYRVGLGLETNYRLSRFFKVGGYFAYGFRDKKWKWGGDMSFTIYQRNMLQLNLSYHDDLYQRGGTYYSGSEFFFSEKEMFKNFFISLMERERFAAINVSGLIKQNMKLQLFANYHRFTFLDDYRYNGPNSTNVNFDRFNVAEFGFVLNWNIFERVMMLEDQRVTLGSKWPKIMVRGAKGVSGVFDSSYDYYRFNLEVDQTFKLRAIGKINLVAKGGITLGNAPLTLQQVLDGTGKFALGFFVPNSFVTMRPAEFFSDRFAALFFNFSFLPIQTKLSWTAPTFVLYSAAGIGTMETKSTHQNFDFNIPDKGYYESGLKIDNLLKVQFLGLGVGVFYRYGPHALPDLKNNFFAKGTLTVGF